MEKLLALIQVNFKLTLLKNDMVMFCWWKANSPEAITDTLGEMADMFHNDIKEMSNVMDVTD